jgi:hypothetical protein
MSAQHTPGPKVHLRYGGRSACRYSSRPSLRPIVAPTIQAFADTPTERRCKECQRAFDAACDAIISKATTHTA